MRKNKCIAGLVASVFLLIQSIQASAAGSMDSFDPNYRFEVTLKNHGGQFRKKGSDLEWRGDELLVKDEDGSILTRYSRESIEVIEGRPPLNVLKGLGYGAAGGLATPKLRNRHSRKRPLCAWRCRRSGLRSRRGFWWGLL